MRPPSVAALKPPAAGTTSDWTRFTARVFADPDLFAALEAAPDRDAFARLAVRLGAKHGFCFTTDDALSALVAARRAWLERNTDFAPAAAASSRLSDDDTASPPSAHWLPVHLATRPATGEPELNWAFFGDLRLTDPFFEQTAGATLRNPARLLFRRRTPLSRIEALAGAAPVLPPAGFIFHLSRCGSTLLAQVLAASPRNRVLSEAPPIDQLLAHDAAHPALTFAQRIARLRGLIHAFARPRFPEERHLYIKWDAWHTLHLPLIRAAFPDTPWIFLHRDPAEVLVSQRRQRGQQFIPGMMDPRPFGITPDELPTLDFDTYTARVLGASATAAVNTLTTPGHRGRAVAYRELPAAIDTLVRAHFGVAYDETDLALMRAAAGRNSKNPVLPFADDTEGKRREADPALQALAERWIGESHRRLATLSAAGQALPQVSAGT